MTQVATVLNSGASSYTVTNAIMNSAGSTFNVGDYVMDSDGNSFLIFSLQTTVPVSVKSTHIHTVEADHTTHTVTARTRTYST